MPDSGVELGADLYLLWRAGRDDLPAVAEVFGKVVRDLGTVRHADADWTALQRELSGVLAATGAGLQEAGRALRGAAVAYAQADAGAAAELVRLKRVNGDPVPHGVVRER